MLRALDQCTPGAGAGAGPEDAGEGRKPDFDATNDKQILAKVANQGLTRSKFPPITDEIVKQQAEAASKRHSKAKTCTGSLCPSISSKGVSGYEQQANVTSPMADISRLLPTGGGSHNRIGGKRQALKLVLLVEDGVWPEYTLHEEGTWAAHRKLLSLEQRHAEARPCVRATIQKTEVRGPKTSPFVVYMLHVRTAFTVRGLPRRYSDFVMLDSKLRAHFVNGIRIPELPAKRFVGQLSADFILERRRQLQDYLDQLMAHASFAHSPPVLDFLQVQGNATEEQIVREAGQDSGPRLWDMPPGAPTDGIELVVEQLRKRGDKRQEARALNCLALMHSQALNMHKAIPALQSAIALCREALAAGEALQAHSGTNGGTNGTGAPQSNAGPSVLPLAAPMHGEDECSQSHAGGCDVPAPGPLNGGGGGENVGRGGAWREAVDDAGGELVAEMEFWAEGLITCVANLASVLLRAGHAQGALERYRESVEISGQRGDVAAQARNMAKIALVLAFRSDLTGAIKVGRGALDMLAATGANGRQGSLSYSLASVYLSLGELRLAVESLEACLVVRRRARDKVGLAEALYKLGVCFVEIGYTAQALDHLQQSLALSQELGDSLGQALALSQLAAVYLEHAEATRALALYDQALQLFAHRAHLAGQVGCHQGMSKGRALLSDALMADLHAQEAARLRRQADETDDQMSGAVLTLSPAASPVPSPAASRQHSRPGTPDAGSKAEAGWHQGELVMGVSFMATPTHPTLATAGPSVHQVPAVSSLPRASASQAVSAGEAQGHAMDAAMHQPPVLLSPSLPTHQAGEHAETHAETHASPVPLGTGEDSGVAAAASAGQLRVGEAEVNGGGLSARRGSALGGAAPAFDEEEDLLGGASRGGRSRRVVSSRPHDAAAEESEDESLLDCPPTPLRTPKSEAPNADANADALLRPQTPPTMRPQTPPTTPAVPRPNVGRISVSEHLQASAFMAGEEELFDDYQISSPTRVASKSQQSAQLPITADGDGTGGKDAASSPALRSAEEDVGAQRPERLSSSSPGNGWPNGNGLPHAGLHGKVEDILSQPTTSGLEHTNGHLPVQDSVQPAVDQRAVTQNMTAATPKTPQASKRKKKR